MQHSSDSLPHKLTDNSVVCLMAPTASGKTALAYELYDTGRYELISVDSALIYRDMTIGTAKPSADELARYPHHLVDIIDPTQSYSVAEFVADVANLIDNCHKNGKIPLLVGGTMMYYMALLDGLSPVPDSDDSVRARVDQWRQEEGIEALHDYLGQVDPISHERLNATDTQRITRAIEVYLQTNIPISDWQRQPKQALAHNPNQQWHALTIMPDRPWLHARIAQRLDLMWNEGLVAEVIGLLEKYPLTPNMPAMRCVGYRQVLEYLVHINHPIFELSHLDKAQFYEAFGKHEGGIDGKEIQESGLQSTAQPSMLNHETEALACQEMQNKALYATRQLAKRQYTWLRKVMQLPNVSGEKVVGSESETDSASSHMILQTFETMAQAREYLS
ncbi:MULTISPECIES: tRNA (adenosine(37)-N6)-dimethylallyltransferase MiaA [unclassified Psychrobacter]|uniref:tRNA (adenosine(37)-N6)-dimethylallyltransferase MiaA n=1 Tax=unclassified Psychrobacter TaxID=196806 RepID=UPI0025B60ACE|nr:MULTISPECIES: tRNA (adenosine(37)-N6)-dimethylallyltransferase MiaA [unclassified Psychrobacter]MDN3453762.1 tRNA (adenosine(37)-N6)-dimethylallyltransferase MiaA [Psychrobacter sp. APC 3350]MDN3503087.1 tRNA (adenosine(37)-N6)-dimethylallyltransferase MiaA [Psychrobacter sp. 5A.1]